MAYMHRHGCRHSGYVHVAIYVFHATQTLIPQISVNTIENSLFLEIRLYNCGILYVVHGTTKIEREKATDCFMCVCESLAYSSITYANLLHLKFVEHFEHRNGITSSFGVCLKSQ